MPQTITIVIAMTSVFMFKYVWLQDGRQLSMITYWFIDQLREIIRSLSSSFFAQINGDTETASSIVCDETIVSDSWIDSFSEFLPNGRIWRRTIFGTRKEEIGSWKTEETQSIETWPCGDPWSTKCIVWYRWLCSLLDRTIIRPSFTGFVSDSGCATVSYDRWSYRWLLQRKRFTSSSPVVATP